MADNLQKDNERLAALNLRQRQFFADITHEVRNPLHALLTTFDMLELDLPAERRQSIVDTARAQITRIRQLFEDLGTIARFEEDPNFIRKEVFDLDEMLYEMSTLYQETAQEKGLTLDLESKVGSVLADPRKIQQVLDNLISNAVKYTQKGWVKVRAEELKRTQKTRITVEDSGIGIDAEHLPHLFERFYRTDKARSRDMGGTGLGLSVVKSILVAHGTEIHVSSEPGKGTTFWFELDSMANTKS
jgi:signal transduction histidine kinase